MCCSFQHPLIGMATRGTPFLREGVRLQQIIRLEKMGEETQIVQLSGLDKEEIARRVLQILNESNVERFTVLLQRSTKKIKTTARESALRLEGRGMGSERCYRTSQFASLHRSSTISNNDSSDLQSNCQTLSPLNMAQHLYALGKHAQALDMLTGIRQECKQEGQGQKGEEKEVLVGIANCEFQLGRYEEAASLYRSILTHQFSPEGLRSPEAAQIFNNLGSSYAQLNLEKLSMNAFAQAIDIYHLHPHMDCSPLYSNIAGIYLKAGMAAAAEGYYLRAIAERKKKRPNHRELILHCYRRLAQAQAKLGKFSEAEEHLAKATKMAESGVGSIIDTLREEAELRERQGKWTEAMDFYEKLHVLHDEQEEGEGCRGYLYEKASRIYQHLGKNSEHKKYLDKAAREYRKSGNVAKLCELQTACDLDVHGNSVKVNQ